MGVRGLERIKREKAKLSERSRNINEYNNEVLAFDASNYIYRFVISIRDENEGYDMITTKGTLISHIYGVFYKTLNILRFNIIPCWVFDGVSPSIKNITVNRRKQLKIYAQNKINNKEYVDNNDRIKLSKRTFQMTKHYTKEIQILLGFMSIPYVQSIGEAEAQCAVMNISGKVKGVVTEDWDALPFGSLTMLRNFSNKKAIREISLNKLLAGMGLTHEQFIEVCIILGNDYSPGIKGVTSVSLFEEYIKFKNMDKFLAHIRHINTEELRNDREIKYDIPPNFDKIWRSTKDYYQNVRVIDPKSIDVEWTEPDYDNLKNYLIDKFEFDKTVVNDDIQSLKNLYFWWNKNRNKNKNNNVEQPAKIKPTAKIVDRKISKVLPKYYLKSRKISEHACKL